MQDTSDISDEIRALREQIASAEAAITRHTDQAGSSSADDAELGELVKTRDLMVARLSRLESCKRTPGE